MNQREAEAKARKVLGDVEVAVRFGEGHAGRGWYAWELEYPEHGSVRLDDGLYDETKTAGDGS